MFARIAACKLYQILNNFEERERRLNETIEAARQRSGSSVGSLKESTIEKVYQFGSQLAKKALKTNFLRDAFDVSTMRTVSPV